MVMMMSNINCYSCVTADEGGQAIGDMLTANHTLKKLLLSSNLLGERIIEKFNTITIICIPVKATFLGNIFIAQLFF